MLGAVHDPAAAGAVGGGSERYRDIEVFVGAVARFRHADGEQAARIARKPWQDAGLLLLSERLLHDLGDLEGLGEHDGYAHIGGGQFFHHHRGGHGIRAKTAPPLGEGHGAQAQLVRLLHDLPRKTQLGIRVGIECGSTGFDLVLVEARHCLQDGALILIDGEHLFH